MEQGLVDWLVGWLVCNLWIASLVHYLMVWVVARGLGICL